MPTTLTRSQYESLAVDECGPWMLKASMAVTADGTNASLNAPLRKALAGMGVAAADPTAVTDDDLAAIDFAADGEEFNARLTLAVLETCQTRIARSDALVEGVQSLHSPMMKALAQIVDGRRAALLADFGPGLATGGLVSAGAVGLGSTAEDECDGD